MIETPAFRRHTDGSIDFDFYRARAVALRRQALRDVATQRISSVGGMVMAGALGFAVVLPCTTAAMRDQMASARSSRSRTR